MFLSFFKSFFKKIIQLFPIFGVSSSRNYDDAERIQGTSKGEYQLVRQNDEYEDETDLELDRENTNLTMHRIEFKDKQGSLRFRLQYMPKRDILSVTILDAQDLPAMDSDGKSDPYVEVSKFIPMSHSSCNFNEDSVLLT